MTTMTNHIIENTTFSYSSLSTFNTCHWGWYLTYIDSVDREDNFFSQYGTLIHNILEGYWNKEYTLKSMVKIYKELYPTSVTCSPPPYPVGMEQQYYKDGISFFKSFDIKRKRFTPLYIENKIVDEYDGVKVIVKPDLVLKDKITNDIYLLDYKTSKPVTKGEWNLSKIKGYETQLLLYAYFIEKNLNIKIDKIGIMFTRVGNTFFVDITDEKKEETLNWFSETVTAIKKEKEFKADTSNKYFCDNLCSVRKLCTYR